MSGKKQPVKPYSAHYWAAHCNERCDTQKGCQQEAAPLYLWWTERIATAALPTASAMMGIHSSLDTQQTKCGQSKGAAMAERRSWWLRYRKQAWAVRGCGKEEQNQCTEEKEQVESVKQSKCIRTTSVPCSLRNEGAIEKNPLRTKIKQSSYEVTTKLLRKEQWGTTERLKFPVQESVSIIKF